MMAMSPIKRPSLGQIAHLGDFYDARNDSFLSLSFLNCPPPPIAIGRTDNPKTEMNFIEKDTYEEKFRHLGVDAELGASILSGLISVGGVGHFLMDGRSSARTRHISCLYKLMTAHEKLHIGAFMMNPELKAMLNFDALRSSPGTHIVTEIEWGASSALTVQYDVEETDSKTEVQTKAGLGLDELNKIMGVGAKAEANLQVGRETRTRQANFAIKVYGDFAADRDLPTDFESAQEYVRRMSSCVAAYNEGKGKPLVYTLFPIHTLCMMFFDLNLEYHLVLRRLSFGVLEQFVQLFDEWGRARRTLADYCVDAARYEFCLPAGHLKDASENLRQAKICEARLKEAYGEALTSVRRGESEPTCLSALLTTSFQNECSPQSLLSIAERYRERMKFADIILGKGGLFVGRDMKAALDNYIMTSGKNDTYVFYFDEAAQLQTERWQDGRRLLMELLESKDAGDRVIVCDCDLGGVEIDKSFVEHYRGGKLVSKDLGEDRRLLADSSVVRYTLGALDPSEFYPPVQRRKLKLRCPGTQCPPTKHIWICETCRQSVEFGFVDTFLYCRCGRFPYDSCRFRCKQHWQEEPMTKPEPSRLLEALKKLQPLTVQEINVLVLGETGVGKSTWINAFVNYLNYDTLAEAMQAGKPKYVVPYSFSYQEAEENGKLKEHFIEGGKSEDENPSSKGESATQRTIVYRIPLGDEMVLRLIDTPGIGDTRGIAYDILNQEDILATLHHIDKLHGVLILLRPTNARLNIMFRFCITELMSHLHRDATDNICFGFTNTRGSNYSAGDTYHPLKSLLSEYKGANISLSYHNTYCFDSESFRFLAALSETNVELFRRQDAECSWERSVKESKRLLEHWSTLPGHRVKSTLSLNKARDVLLAIKKPLDEVTKAADKTIQLSRQNMEQLRGSSMSRAELESKLYIETVVIESIPLPKPRMVCTHAACQAMSNSNTGDASFEHGNGCHQECHAPLGIHGFGGSFLLTCRVFECGLRRTCKHCSHHWTTHERITNVSRPKTMREIDPKVQAMIESVSSAAELKAAGLRGLTQFMEECEAKMQLLTEASAQFGRYLGSNSIVIFNRERVKYMERKIMEASSRTIRSGTCNVNMNRQGLLDSETSSINSLEGQKKQMEEEEAVFSRIPSSLDGSLTPQEESGGPTEGEIETTLLRLFDMDSWGSYLRESVSKAKQRQYKEHVFDAHLHGRSQRNSWDALLARAAVSEPHIEPSWRSEKVTAVDMTATSLLDVNAPSLQMISWRDIPRAKTGGVIEWELSDQEDRLSPQDRALWRAVERMEKPQLRKAIAGRQIKTKKESSWLTRLRIAD